MDISRELLSRLPERALMKWRALEQEREEVWVLGRDIAERFPRISQRLRQLEVQLADRRQNPQRASSTSAAELNVIERNFAAEQAHPLMMRTGRTASTTPRTSEAEIKALEDEVAALTEERQRIDERQQLYNAKRQSIGTLQASIGAWLSALPAAIMIDEHDAKPRDKLRDVTSDLIEQRRRRVRELHADIRRIDAAPYPSGVVKDQVRQRIETLAARGEPGFDAVIEYIDREIDWPMQTIRLLRERDVHIPDALGLVALLLKDQLIALAENRIDAIADDSQALTDAARGEQFKTLFADLLEAERNEEAAVSAATFQVIRRTDADPRAVLGLASSLPGPKRDGLVHARLALGGL
ncbi:hypothetical protein [Bradyrhizobium septentrionale]|uniref:DUF3375 domain-containing protein n=1 Tax=Bradyrhizobium septentrionale TaxID=1404411 RepID=A0ABZ2P9K7_9BRAD